MDFLPPNGAGNLNLRPGGINRLRFFFCDDSQVIRLVWRRRERHNLPTAGLHDPAWLHINLLQPWLVLLLFPGDLSQLERAPIPEVPCLCPRDHPCSWMWPCLWSAIICRAAIWSLSCEFDKCLEKKKPQMLLLTIPS